MPPASSPETDALTQPTAPLEYGPPSPVQKSSPTGKNKKGKNSKLSLLPPDAFEDKLIVMADVCAYFHVAYKHIINHVPLKIKHSMHQALAGKPLVTLLQSLIMTA
ncbi:hypothetical protein PAXINDRAFT_14680 [Paxillus involutus ATCC 200175]|uniref:Uncharacterized protein n=1 Tax=Paxillus involutus ATCC 200175 TaxID=664439 RepID=A0A0C9TA14_PAXIN|nr:hypothetical protein PAXINDRAFT_14680 [Paxillus involutus ATCC 200175]